MGKFLKDASPGVVAAAAYVLSGMGPAAAEHVTTLEAALGNESETWPDSFAGKSGELGNFPGNFPGNHGEFIVKVLIQLSMVIFNF